MNQSNENQQPADAKKDEPIIVPPGAMSGKESGGTGKGSQPGRIYTGSSTEESSTESNEERREQHVSVRLIDEIVAYIQTRQQAESEKAKRPVDEEQVARAALHQLRNNPIPTVLLGFSALWLLFAKSEAEREEERRASLGGELEEQYSMEGSYGGPEKSDLVERLEEAVIGQVKGGYEYTNHRLKEVAERFPWAAAAVAVGGGILAAVYLPDPRRKRKDHDEASAASTGDYGIGPRPEREPFEEEGVGVDPVTGKSYLRDNP